MTSRMISETSRRSSRRENSSNISAPIRPRGASLPQPAKEGVNSLPCAGNRNGSSVSNVGSNGNYWSSSPNGTANAYNLNFTAGSANMNNNNRSNGYAVRLVSVQNSSGMSFRS